MKKLLFGCLAFMVIASCKKTEKQTQNACDCDSPMDNVLWLKDMKKSITNCTCEISIIQGTYKGQVVFFTALTDPLCDGIDIPTLFDCNGKVMKTFTSDDYQDFYNDVTRDKVLYPCKN